MQQVALSPADRALLGHLTQALNSATQTLEKTMSEILDVANEVAGEIKIGIAYIKTLADQLAIDNANGADVTASIGVLRGALADLQGADKPVPPVA